MRYGRLLSVLCRNGDANILMPDMAACNKKAQIKCPHCGSKNTGRWSYGYPAYDEKLQSKLDSGKIKLGFFEGHSDIEIKRTETGAHVHVVGLPYGEDCSIDRDITTGKWYKIINQLYNRMYLHEWKKKYVNPNVLDGTQWDLKVTLSGGRERNYYGSNDFPPYWTELKAIFMPYLKNNKRL